MTADPLPLAAEARDARRDLETALDGAGWPWSRSCSLWLDALVVMETARGDDE
jgi:hypothetical protein